jgi:hypothetical protein
MTTYRRFRYVALTVGAIAMAGCQDCCSPEPIESASAAAATAPMIDNTPASASTKAAAEAIQARTSALLNAISIDTN